MQSPRRPFATTMALAAAVALLLLISSRADAAIPGSATTPTGPTARAVGSTGYYTTSATDPDGDNVRYYLDWGDGSAHCVTGYVASGSSTGCNHAWSATGSYCVRAYAQDNKGGQSTYWSSCRTVSVTQPPTAQPVSPSGSLATVAQGQSASFQGKCANPAGNLLRAEYYQRNAGQANYQWMDSDTVQYQSNPWVAHAWSTTFSPGGQAGVLFRCIDQNGGVSDHVWSVTVTSSNRVPNQASTPSGAPAPNVGQGASYSTSATDPDGNNVRYHIDWGDGSSYCITGYVASGGSASCSHSWSSAGNYCVRAYAQDTAGAISTYWSSCLTVAVNQPPTAQPVSPNGSSATAVQDQPASFQGKCVNPDGNLAKAEYFRKQPGESNYWLMDTDNVWSQANPWVAHAWSTSFSSTGTGGVLFRCTDQNGAASDHVWSVTVAAANRAPGQPATPNGPTMPTIGQGGSYITSATDPDGNTVRYALDWGDGSSSCVTGYVASGASAGCSHSWAGAGSHCVRAYAQDSIGAIGPWSSCLTVTVNQPPTAQPVSPSGSSASATEGQSTTFQGKCVNPDGNLAKAEYFRKQPGESNYWLMDTDNVWSQANPWVAHAWSTSFAPAGTGGVLFRCTDQNGDASDFVWSVTVTNQPPSVNDINPAQSLARSQDQSQTFSATGTDPEGRLISYQWDVQRPGGAWHSVAGASISASVYTSSHTVTFDQAGAWQVRVTFKDNAQQPATATWGVGVTNQPPTLSALSPAQSLSRNEGQTQAFSATGTDPEGRLASYVWEIRRPGGAWQFETGGSPAQSPHASDVTVTFDQSGAWQVRVTYKDDAQQAASNVWGVEVAAVQVGAPTGLTANYAAGNPSSIRLAWSAPAGTAPLSYKVYRGTVPGGEQAYGTSTGTQYDNTGGEAGLACGTAYYYQVSGINSSGVEGPRSNEASAATPPCSSGTHDWARGVDVSFVQETVDWTQAANSGLNFAIARVGDGVNTHDNQFSANWAAMQKEGLVRGAYHVLRAGYPGDQQARAFLDNVTKAGGFQQGVAADLPPIIDLEPTDRNKPSQSSLAWRPDQNSDPNDPSSWKWEDPGKLAQELRTFVTAIQSQLHVTPILYTTAAAWNEWTSDPSWPASESFIDLPLWAVDWSQSASETASASAGPTASHIPRGWSNWTLWQYSGGEAAGSVQHISVPGIGPVDTDYFHGNATQLRAYSRVAWAPQPTSPPSAPGTALARAVGPNRVDVSWKAPTSGSAPIRYYIYRSSSPGSGQLIGSAEAPALAFQDTTNMVPDTRYYYSVAAANSAGISPRSAEVSAKTAATPSAPLAVSSQVSGTEIRLSWNPPTSPGSAPITHYRLYRWTPTTGREFLGKTEPVQVGQAAATTFSLSTPPTAETKLFFQVRAVNARGEGVWSETVTVLTPRPAKPGAPLLTAEPGDNRVTLTWSPTTTGGSPITAFNLHRIQSDGTRAIFPLNKTQTTYIDLQATNGGETLQYKVTAVNVRGEGPPSLAAMAQASPAFGTTHDEGLPVLFLHGIDGCLTDTCGHAPGHDLSTYFGAMPGILRDAGWSADQMRVLSYYVCDQDKTPTPSFPAHLSMDVHPSADARRHDRMMGNATWNHAPSCTADSERSHTTFTPIEHLAYHWAWTVWDDYESKGSCVNVVAHSMGGLIVRYGLQRTEARDSAFPPSLCVKAVVTLGTPYDGFNPTEQRWCDSWQCQEMTQGSEFSRALAANALNPWGRGGTRWVAIGSDGDNTVPSDSAVQPAADLKVVYRDGDDSTDVEDGDPPNHWNCWDFCYSYFSPRPADERATATFKAAGRPEERRIHTLWPAALGHSLLAGPSWACGAAGASWAITPGMVVHGEPNGPGGDGVCRFTVTIPANAPGLVVTVTTTEAANPVDLLAPGATVPVPCRQEGAKTTCVANAPNAGEWSIVVWGDPFALRATLPGPPQKVVASAVPWKNPGQIYVKWNVPRDNGSAITGYQVWRSITSGAEVPVAKGRCSAVGTTLECLDLALESGKTYYYQIRAANAYGYGLRGAEVQATAP